MKPRIPDKNVYILGSGFSAGCGIPTIRDFIPKGLELLKNKALEEAASSPISNRAPPPPVWHSDIVPVLEVLAHHEPMLRRMHGRDPNLEDFFCAVDAAGESVAENRKDDRKVLVKFVHDVCETARVKHAVKKAGMGKPGQQIPNKDSFPFVSRDCVPFQDGTAVQEYHFQGAPVACVYEAFLAQVFADAAKQGNRGFGGGEDGKPAVISLNYDLVLEGTLAELCESAHKSEWARCGFNYGKDLEVPTPWQPPVTVVDLVKIHGSLNWRKGANTSRRYVVTPAFNSIELAPMNDLVMPTWVRMPRDVDLRGRLLNRAVDHLRVAERIIVIGYSLPDTDLYLRYLLAEALDTPEQPEIVICSRFESPTDAENAGRRMFGSHAHIVGVPSKYDLAAFLESGSPKSE